MQRKKPAGLLWKSIKYKIFFVLPGLFPAYPLIKSGTKKVIEVFVRVKMTRVGLEPKTSRLALQYDITAPQGRSKLKKAAASQEGIDWYLLSLPGNFCVNSIRIFFANSMNPFIGLRCFSSKLFVFLFRFTFLCGCCCWAFLCSEKLSMFACRGCK